MFLLTTATFLWLSSMLNVQNIELVGSFDAACISSSSIIPEEENDSALSLWYEENATLSTSGGRTANVQLRQVDPFFCRQINAAQGRVFHKEDKPESGIMISEKTAVSLFGQKNVVGMAVNYSGKSGIIIGVFSDTKTPWGALTHHDEHEAYVLRKPEAPVNRITVYSRDLIYMHAVENNLPNLVRSLQIVRTGEKQRFIQDLIRLLCVCSVFSLTFGLRRKSMHPVLRVCGWCLFAGCLFFFLFNVSVPVRFIPKKILPSSVLDSFFKWVTEQNQNTSSRLPEARNVFWYAFCMLPLSFLQVILSRKVNEYRGQATTKQ